MELRSLKKSPNYDESNFIEEDISEKKATSSCKVLFTYNKSSSSYDSIPNSQVNRGNSSVIKLRPSQFKKEKQTVEKIEEFELQSNMDELTIEKKIEEYNINCNNEQEQQTNKLNNKISFRSNESIDEISKDCVGILPIFQLVPKRFSKKKWGSCINTPYKNNKYRILSKGY